MNPYACAVEGCRCRKLWADDRVCSGHMLGFLCGCCSRPKRPADELCPTCAHENAIENERSAAPPPLRLIRGDG